MSRDLRKFYDDCNANRIVYPKNQSLHGLIAESCRKYSNKTAIVCEDQSLTFEQFDRAANELANYLIEQGVKQGDLVGVCCDRDLDMPVLLNGVLRTGAAYVPLDPDYPLDRLIDMAENGELVHVIGHNSQREIIKHFTCGATFYDDAREEISKRSQQLPEIEIDPHTDVAYVIYTSGSTGKPKGVLVPHQAAVNSIFAFSQQPGFTENDRVLASTTLSFDISVTEIFLPLYAGGQCVIVDRVTAKDQNRLDAAIKKHGITPFYVVSEKQDWPKTEQPRRAGVSSFGIGGTNAHIVVEEAPSYENQDGSSPTDVQLLKISARNEDALRQVAGRLADDIAKQSHSLGAIASTLEYGRESFSNRAFVVARGHSEASQLLKAGKAPGFTARKCKSNPRDVVFMFPGQGSQYVRMGQDLCSAFPVFKESIGLCSEILLPLINRDLRDILFPAAGYEEAATEILKATQYTQPALFSLGFSLARTIFDLGIKPTAMIGHSIGEFAAACVAGVFSLEDGLNIIAKRGALMQSLPGGSMLSVRKAGHEVEKLIGGDVSIASYNGPQLCVIAGPDDDVEAIKQQLEGQGIACRYLHTSHAFHSSMMDSIVEPYEKFVAEVHLSVPQIPILSTVTGQWMTDQQAVNPRYWAEHLRKPVRFSDAVTQIWSEDPSRVLVELGPRKTLATLAMQHATDRKQQIAIPTLSDTSQDFSEQKTLLTALGHLWTVGVSANMQRLLPADAQKISLPTYAFQRKRFFVEPCKPAAQLQLLGGGTAAIPQPAVEGQLDREIEALAETSSHQNATQHQPTVPCDVQPCDGAKLGQDRNGNPGWFIADVANPGQFIPVGQTY